jgi:hypothetical protein
MDGLGFASQNNRKRGVTPSPSPFRESLIQPLSLFRSTIISLRIPPLILFPLLPLTVCILHDSFPIKSVVGLLHYIYSTLYFEKVNRENNRIWELTRQSYVGFANKLAKF